MTATHCFDDIECSNGDGGERCLSSARNHDIDKIVANVTERFADRNRAAGATVRVRCADTAKSKIDRDVRMGRTAEHLHGESRLNSARTLFQKTNVIFFGFTNSAQRRPEADADAVLWMVVRIFNSRVIEREFCRGDSELRVAVQPFQAV